MGEKDYGEVYKEVREILDLIMENKEYFIALFETPETEYAGTLPFYTDFKEKGGIEKFLKDVGDIKDKFEYWGSYLRTAFENKGDYDPDSPES